MDFFIIFYSFILGLLIGSFLNVVGLRVPLGKSIVKPRSACTTCKRTLTATDLIPVISFLFFGGKCKTCGEKISIMYPTVELLTGLLYAYAAYSIGIEWELLAAFLLISLGMVIIVTDISYMLIPNKILLFFAIVIIPIRVLSPLTPWWDAIVGAIVGFVLLYFVAVVSKGGMGGGDVKLFAVLGLFLGLKGVLLTFFLSTFIGAVFGIIGLISGKIKRKQAIPFGPYIIVASLIAYFFGEQMIMWYIEQFFSKG
ncbi:prepilin peptidase [Lottiidibacillus patelloidae]|uniref:Prepilin peptidase n=1 Tax=Lottiidibacillus patelloidae TaxID=2670334 RepID=A0A263BVX8_9BACI|nr:A24 family peptidase [Lottiidibacillus patelloidae]OZM57865.1 prepilin peptidase [Lottiidibacillus patelloidae]